MAGCHLFTTDGYCSDCHLEEGVKVLQLCCGSFGGRNCGGWAALASSDEAEIVVFVCNDHCNQRGCYADECSSLLVVRSLVPRCRVDGNKSFWGV